MANPDIATLTAIRGESAGMVVTTTPTNLVSNTAASGKVFKLNTLIVSNVDGASSATVNIEHVIGGTGYHIAKNVSVPAGSSFIAVSKETTIYVKEDEHIRLTASANGDLEAVASYEDIS